MPNTAELQRARQMQQQFGALTVSSQQAALETRLRGTFTWTRMRQPELVADTVAFNQGNKRFQRRLRAELKQELKSALDQEEHARSILTSKTVVKKLAESGTKRALGPIIGGVLAERVLPGLNIALSVANATREYALGRDESARLELSPRLLIGDVLFQSLMILPGIPTALHEQSHERATHARIVARHRQITKDPAFLRVDPQLTAAHKEAARKVAQKNPRILGQLDRDLAARGQEVAAINLQLQQAQQEVTKLGSSTNRKDRRALREAQAKAMTLQQEATDLNAVHQYATSVRTLFPSSN